MGTRLSRSDKIALIFTVPGLVGIFALALLFALMLVFQELVYEIGHPKVYMAVFDTMWSCYYVGGPVSLIYVFCYVGFFWDSERSFIKTTCLVTNGIWLALCGLLCLGNWLVSGLHQH